MDLFVIDNVGENNLLSKDAISNVKTASILNNSTEVRNSQLPSSSDADNDGEYTEDDGDFGGELLKS